jgi:hypothetical protein
VSEYGNYTNAPFIISNSKTICFTIEANLETDGKSNDYFLADDYVIVPEFPSWTVLPLIVATTAVAAAIRRRHL